MSVNTCDIQIVQGSEFLQGFRSADHNRLTEVWDEIQRPQGPYAQGREDIANFPFEHAQIQPPELTGNA